MLSSWFPDLVLSGSVIELVTDAVEADCGLWGMFRTTR